jgi:SAM-dependent methyltransferase
MTVLKLDLATETLPWDDETLDYAVCHHALCMFDLDGLDHALAEMHRTIKHGGTLRISLADTLGAIAARERGEYEWFSGFQDYLDPKLDVLTGYLFLGGARKSFLTTTILCTKLDAACFTPFIVSYRTTLSDHPEICDLDSREGESIWVEAVRR